MAMKIEYERCIRKGILFVCTGNVFRSKTAAALATNKGICAWSAGFEPSRLKDEFEDLSYFNHGENKNITMDEEAFKFCLRKRVKEYEIEREQKELKPYMIEDSNIVICMNYREHYPMMEKFKITHNLTANNIMYWDIPDLYKEKGWKGHEDNLDYAERNDIIHMIYDKITGLAL